jgi:nicotinate-nucleotide adenylyltransferase
MNIGIYGGSFNPIHRGHIALARQIRRKAHLDEVWFMVSPLNPLKADRGDLLPDELRLALVRKAL